MNDQTLVSLIIVNYNTFSHTCQCVESVMACTKDIDYEIILVDNASDETDPAAFKTRFPEIRLIKNIQNIGFAGGVRSAIPHASGEYLLLLNSDTMLRTNAVKQCRDFLEENPRVGVVTARLKYPDGRTQHVCQRFPSVWAELVELLRLHKLLSARASGRLLLNGFFGHDQPAWPDWVWGTFFMFPRRILDIFPDKNLPGGYFMYTEDMTWCYQIRKAGYKVAYRPEAVAVHLMGSSNPAGSNNRKQETMLRQEIQFMRTHYARARVWLILQLRKIKLRMAQWQGKPGAAAQLNMVRKVWSER